MSAHLRVLSHNFNVKAVNEDKLLMCEALQNNDVCKAGVIPTGNMVWRRSDQKNSKRGLPTADTRPTFSWTLVQLGGGLKERQL